MPCSHRGRGICSRDSRGRVLRKELTWKEELRLSEQGWAESSWQPARVPRKPVWSRAEQRVAWCETLKDPPCWSLGGQQKQEEVSVKFRRQKDGLRLVLPQFLELPQQRTTDWWLKTEIYSRHPGGCSPKPRCWPGPGVSEGSGEDPSLPLPFSGVCWPSLACPGLQLQLS